MSTPNVCPKEQTHNIFKCFIYKLKPIFLLLYLSRQTIFLKTLRSIPCKERTQRTYACLLKSKEMLMQKTPPLLESVPPWPESHWPSLVKDSVNTTCPKGQSRNLSTKTLPVSLGGLYWLWFWFSNGSPSEERLEGIVRTGERAQQFPRLLFLQGGDLVSTPTADVHEL